MILILVLIGILFIIFNEIKHLSLINPLKEIPNIQNAKEINVSSYVTPLSDKELEELWLELDWKNKVN